MLDGGGTMPDGGGIDVAFQLDITPIGLVKGTCM